MNEDEQSNLFSECNYMIKYNAIIIRLMYAMSSYFKNLDDIDEDEVINTACDSLAIYYSEHLN